MEKSDHVWMSHMAVCVCLTVRPSVCLAKSGSLSLQVVLFSIKLPSLKDISAREIVYIK